MNKTVNSLCIIVHGKNEQELRELQLDHLAMAIKNWSIQFEIVAIVDDCEQVRQYGKQLGLAHPEICFYPCNYPTYANFAIKYGLLNSIGILVFHAETQLRFDRLPACPPKDDDQTIDALTRAGLNFSEYRFHRQKREKYSELHKAHLEIPTPYFAKNEAVRPINN